MCAMSHVAADSEKMGVTVILVGMLRKYATAPSPTVMPCAATTIEDLLKHLAIPSELVAMALVDGVQRPKSYELAPGDVVKLLPLMGGG